jgi:hypothetical protein
VKPAASALPANVLCPTPVVRSQSDDLPARADPVDDVQQPVRHLPQSWSTAIGAVGSRATSSDTSGIDPAAPVGLHPKGEPCRAIRAASAASQRPVLQQQPPTDNTLLPTGINQAIRKFWTGSRTAIAGEAATAPSPRTTRWNSSATRAERTSPPTRAAWPASWV